MAPIAVPAPSAPDLTWLPPAAEEDVVVPLAEVEAATWVQTRERRPLAQPSLPFQPPSPFLPAPTVGTTRAEDLDDLDGTGDRDESELVAVALTEPGRHVA